MAITIRNVKVIFTAPEGINLVAVKVETSEPGLYGLGCASFAYRIEAVRCLINEYLEPLLLGQNVENIEQLWHLMYHNAYWRNGPISNNAISGIDMALWDIKGKMANMPVYQLLGGKVREGVPIYRHADGRDAKEISDNIQRYKEQGIRHVRCQCGGYGGGGYGAAPKGAPIGAPDGIYVDSKAYMRDTIALFDELRNTVGFDVNLCHDVHGRISPIEAISFAKVMEQFDLFFLEDPIQAEQTEWFRRLREQTSIPLAQGELFNHPLEWKELISKRLIDYIRVHMSQIGGITPSRKLQIFAEQFGVKTAWHGPGDMTPMAHAANIHLSLASYNFGVQEWSGTEPPNFVLHELRQEKDALLEVFSGLPEFKDGYVYANDRPGFGIELDEEKAKKYPCDHSVTLWTQTRKMDGTPLTP